MFLYKKKTIFNLKFSTFLLVECMILISLGSGGASKHKITDRVTLWERGIFSQAVTPVYCTVGGNIWCLVARGPGTKFLQLLKPRSFTGDCSRQLFLSLSPLANVG